MASEFFGRQRECRFYTAGCGNKMEVSVTGPLAVNELGGPVIPGRSACIVEILYTIMLMFRPILVFHCKYLTVICCYYYFIYFISIAPLLFYNQSKRLFVGFHNTNRIELNLNKYL